MKRSAIRCFAAKRVDQLQDRRLHRNVERGGRLVEDQEARLGDQRPRDPDPRLLAAGELMRAARRDAPGRGRPPRRSPRRAGARPRRANVVPSPTAMLRAVLKAGLSASPAFWKTSWSDRRSGSRTKRAGGTARDVAAGEADHALARVRQADDELRQRRLARSAFADDAEAAALGEREIDAVEGMEQPPASDGEELLQPGRPRAARSQRRPAGGGVAARIEGERRPFGCGSAAGRARSARQSGRPAASRSSCGQRAGNALEIGDAWRRRRASRRSGRPSRDGVARRRGRRSAPPRRTGRHA